MSHSSKILVVDDSAENRMLLKMLLEDDYDICEAESGMDCLQLFETDDFDLLLLDANMPGISGYQVCQTLRQQPKTETLPIIFVSGLDSSEERLAGFEAGADEYVIKPVDGLELQEKVKAHLTRQKERQATTQDAHNAMKVAMEAMTVSSELGQIIEFIKNGQRMENREDLGRAMLNVAEYFGLHASVMVCGEDCSYFGCEVNSVEARLLNKARGCSERIVTIGIRTIFRHDNIAMLIKNMPTFDENRCDRLKDHLAVLTDIGDGYLRNFNTQLAAKKQRQVFLARIIALVEEQTKVTSDKIMEHEQLSTNIMNAMLEKLEAMLFSLGLDEDQEIKLIKLADNTSRELHSLNEKTHDLSKELGAILESLYSFYEREK